MRLGFSTLYQRLKSCWKKRSGYQKIGLVLILLVLFYLIFQFFSRSDHRLPPTLVKAVTVRLQDVPLTIKSIGTIESTESVVIMPQVTGLLTKIAVEPGQQVKAGQLLFAISSDSLTAALKQAQAILQRDQAQLSYLEANAKRYANLVKLEYVTRDQYEQTKATAAAQIALVKSDEEQVKQAQIDLSHTQITAPTNGKIGNFSVRVGELMVANTTNIATINQLSPVWIDFNIPQQQLPSIQAAQEKQSLQVKIFSEDGKNELAKATLFFIDNTVNVDTGTILLKAEAENQDYHLWPGQMITAKLILTIQKNAIVIPLQAVQIDDAGSYVYKLVDHKAVLQRITVARQVNQLAIIAAGLQPGQLVLTIIPPNLQDGAIVARDDEASQNT